MPIYEEKLICPLAVRFTQQHIRPVFQEGRALQDTIKQIEARPGKGDYDVILSAPFPNIEIIRWSQKDEEHAEKNTRHWFTLDNRRLYCLQYVAATLWPKRVAVTVEVLYAAPDGFRRKSNSLSVGRTVGIGHSLKDIVSWWDWREVVAGASPSTTTSDEEVQRAHHIITTDDVRSSIEQLEDAPTPPSMLEMYLQSNPLATDAIEVPKDVKYPGSEGSTADPCTPRSASDSEASNSPTRTHQTHQELNIAGTWSDDFSETYQVKATEQGDSLWTGERVGKGSGPRRVTLWVDEVADTVWWGTTWTHYAQASLLYKREGAVRWYAKDDVWGSWPQFTWWPVGGVAAVRGSGSKQVASQKSRVARGKHIEGQQKRT